MHPSVNIAKRAALSAGKLILRHYGRLERVTVRQKANNELVSEVDLQAEEEIVKELRRIYPGFSILTEESGVLPGDTDYQWIVDPLDGTSNFLHGFPHFAISIALLEQGRLAAAVIYDPLRQELFTASRGTGAQLNDRRIRITPQSHVQGALLAVNTTDLQGNRLPQGASVRCSGSAALDLAYVACGRLDGVRASHLHSWDMAAGALLVQEAGGLVGDFRGGHDHLARGEVVAANPKLFRQLLTQG